MNTPITHQALDQKPGTLDHELHILEFVTEMLGHHLHELTGLSVGGDGSTRPPPSYSFVFLASV